jgi:hypothetical protein
VRKMRYAIALEQHEEDDLYHYLPDGGNLTMCGREPQETMTEAPEDRRICEVCDKTEFSLKAKTLDDEALSIVGWDVVRQNRSREIHLLLVSEAVARNLPVCRGTKTSGPHAAIPLLWIDGQSSPCPMCGDIKVS